MQFTFRVIDHNNSEAETWAAAMELARAEIMAGHVTFIDQNFGRWNRLAAIVVEVEQREDLGPLSGERIS